jgi:fructokinase
MSKSPVARSSAVIAVVGEALVDLVVTGDGTITATPGGAPFNVARACARLGMPVSLIAAVSTDRFGQRLTAALAADGVDDAYVQRREQPTTLALADLDPSGGATYCFYLDGTSAPTLSATELPTATRALVAGGLGIAVEPMASAVQRMVVESAGEVLVLVDVNCRPAAIADRDRYLERLDCVLGRADVVKVSVEDLGYVDPRVPATTVASRLLTRCTHAVLLTAGPDATTVLTRAGERVVPVHDVPVVDTIGAGDTFTAAFLVWWMATGRGVDDLDDVDAVASAVEAAHHAAALVVRRRGADPPHRDELPANWARRAF